MADLPNVVDNERGLLASIITDNKLLDDVIILIPSAKYFHDKRHQSIYSAIIGLYERNAPYDFNAVTSELEKLNMLAASGGREYLLTIMDNFVTTGNTIYYADTIKETHKQRQLYLQYQSLAKDIHDNHISSSEILERNEKLLTSVDDNNVIEIMSLGELAAEYVTEKLKNEKKHDEYFITRIQKLNEAITGIFRGDLTVVAGPPSMGKSSLALDICVWNCLKHRRSLYIALDETRRAMVQRVLAGKTGLAAQTFYKQSLLQREEQLLTETALAMAENDYVYICDNSEMTTTAIRSLCRRMKRTKGLDIVVVDYLQQIKASQRHDRRDLEVGAHCRALKAIAKELNVAMIAISQLNRQYDQREISPQNNKFGFPSIAMLRDSGDIEQEANLVLFVWNVLEALKKRGVSENEAAYKHELEQCVDEHAQRAWVNVVKNKIGPTREVECRWHELRMHFYSPTDPAIIQGDLGDYDNNDLPF